MWIYINPLLNVQIDIIYYYENKTLISNMAKFRLLDTVNSYGDLLVIEFMPAFVVYLFRLIMMQAL